MQCTGDGGFTTLPPRQELTPTAYALDAVSLGGQAGSYYLSLTNATGVKVAHCSNLACTPTTQTLTTVVSANNVGEYTSITIGADGLPLISYFDNTNSERKVAHCSNLLCLPFVRRR